MAHVLFSSLDGFVVCESNERLVLLVVFALVIDVNFPFVDAADDRNHLVSLHFEFIIQIYFM